MKNVEIATATHEDIPEIVNLFRSYDFALTRRRWFEWKYFDNPTGKAMMYKILHKSSLVGAVAIIPQVFHYSGKRLVGLQTVDGLLGTEIRGKGFFNELMYFLSTQRPQGVSEQCFYLSFPSLAVSVKAHENAGWRRLTDFQLRTALLNPEPVFRKRGLAAVGKALKIPWAILKKRFMFSSPQTMVLRRINGASPDFNSFLPPGKVAGDRSAGFMQWRVSENPRDQMLILAFRDHGQPAGYAVCKLIDRCLEVTEFRSAPGTCKRMAGALLQYIDANKLADSVDFWIMDKGTAKALPSTLGFFNRDFTGALFVNQHQRCGLPDEPDQWAISYLDSDW